MAETIGQLPPVSWQCIHLDREFDFSNEALTDVLRFHLGALLVIEYKTT